MFIYSGLKVWSVRQASELSEVGRCKNITKHYDEKWYSTVSKWNYGGIVGEKKYQDGLYASEIYATDILITNIFKRYFFLTTHLTMCICVSRVLVQHLLLRQLPSRLLVLVIYSQHSFLHLAWTFFFIDEKVTSSKLGLGAVPGVWSPKICATPDSGKVHVGLVHTQIGGSQTDKLDSLGQLLDALLV